MNEGRGGVRGAAIVLSLSLALSLNVGDNFSRDSSWNFQSNIFQNTGVIFDSVMCNIISGQCVLVCHA